MMGRVSDLSDMGRSLAPYLTWHDERISLLILQLAFISGALLIVAAPYIPWRLVLLVAGETLLFLGHPWARPLMLEASPFIQRSAKSITIQATQLLEDDALTDAELASDFLLIERLEVETQDGATWVPDVIIGGELPKGSKWLRTGDWSIDTMYNEGKVDASELQRSDCTLVPILGADFAVTHSGFHVPSSGRIHKLYDADCLEYG
jgi:hypothetical protein